MIVLGVILFLGGLLSDFIPHGTDPNLTANGPITSVFAYAWSWNQFLPLSDALVPIIGVNLMLFNVGIFIRVSLLVLNFIRGSGAK